MSDPAPDQRQDHTEADHTEGNHTQGGRTEDGDQGRSRRGGHHLHDARLAVQAAAKQAEADSGRRDKDDQQVRRGLLYRILRTVGGFLVIGMGIALLPLPGPGWVIIIVGLSMLPFAWARRTIVLIRRTIPGVPEEGRIPTSTWVVMGLLLAGATAISILFGDRIGSWVAETWTNLWD
ncbi:MAG: PGPGW domain-containing protein [Microthrixaceae bacterium]